MHVKPTRVDTQGHPGHHLEKPGVDISNSGMVNKSSVHTKGSMYHFIRHKKSFF